MNSGGHGPWWNLGQKPIGNEVYAVEGDGSCNQMVHDHLCHNKTTNRISKVRAIFQKMVQQYKNQRYICMHWLQWVPVFCKRSKDIMYRLVDSLVCRGKRYFR